MRRRDIAPRHELLGRPLSARELECLRGCATLDGQKEVARSLGVSLQTVKNHLISAYGKLGVDNEIAAFRAVGWLTVPGEPEIAAERLASVLHDVADDLRVQLHDAAELAEQLEHAA